MTETLPIAVLGAGPAGTALVAALIDAGQEVVWIAPDIPWTNNYGIWVDELDGTGLDQTIFDVVWDSPMVATDLGTHVLDRAYGRIDNEALWQALAPATSRATRVDARVEDVRDDDGTVVIETAGGSHEARFVFDATGHKPVATERPGSNPGFQTAYGIFCTTSGTPPVDHEMSLMDFRTFDGPWDGPPTFLYAMHLPDGRWFLEETVLVARPAVPIGELRDRLYARLADRGTVVEAVFEEERCFIPMGDELPAGRSRVAAFGAAASYVHPATGYSIARSLRAARDVARHIDEGRAGFGGREVLQATASPDESPIWPSERLTTRQYYRFGMETVLGFDVAQTHAFFDAFFRLPEDQWRGYLSDTLTPREVAKVMLTLFGTVGLDMKARLAGSAFGEGQFARLMKGLLGSL